MTNFQFLIGPLGIHLSFVHWAFNIFNKMLFKDLWILLFIPLVVVLILFLRRRGKQPALRFSSTDLFSGFSESWKTRLIRRRIFLRLMAIVLFIIALAGPRQVLEKTQITSEGIDIVLSIDASGSMAAEDFTINGKRLNRLAVVKDVIKEFIQNRKADRIGMVAFGALAYTVCPLTTDYDWLMANLERVILGLIEDGTAVGSGIASSVSRLKDSQAKSRVIILLTDGVNNAGKMDPITAAKTAQALGIKIYTIGAGSKGYVPFPMRDLWGRTVYQKVRIDLDEETLKEIARLTNGSYFRAADTESLREIYKQIDTMEKTRIEQTGYKEYKELFGQFLSAALALLLIEVVLFNTVLLKIP